MSRAIAVLGVLYVLAFPQPGHAFNNGASVVGHSGATAAVCNNCHSGGTAPTVALSGPTTLAAGATGQYSFTITSRSATDKIAGLDVAVSNSAAQLTPVSATVEAAGGEIVHKSAIPLSNGAVTVQLSLKAPATGGPLTLYGAGLAGDAVAAPTGKLAAKTTLAITVTGGVAASPDAGVAPDLGTPSASTVPPATGTNNDPMAPPMAGGCSLTRGSATAATTPPSLVMLSLVLLGLRARSIRTPRSR
ncbi:MAG: putative lipoprotein [Myxococcales bacterium]|nr:putative lipoprotein [Myxococcales bacterium]